MKLKRLKVRNFRCYKEEIVIEFDDITALIGRNDAGKSTIMDALDIFLNDSALDGDDACKDGDPKDLTIICEFIDLPEHAVIDEDVPTTFAAEHLLNSDGCLEIHKTYSGNLAKPKCVSISAFAVHPTINGAADLLQLKNADLKKRAKELGADVSSIDQKVNSQLRESIRKKLGELKLSKTLVPLNDDNAKKAWDGIRSYMPFFALFKSDRASTDQDPEAQDPLKMAVKEAIRQREKELEALSEHVRNEVQRIADRTLEMIKEMDPTLASQLNPEISNKKWDTLFNVSITGDNNIPINKRGSGVKRLVLLNFFRAKAELDLRARNSQSVIYGVEEPETSQHPHNQRLLVSALQLLSTSSQVVMTTHTPVLARVLPDTCLRYIHIEESGARTVMVGGEGTNELLARTLGVLPDNSIKLFIGVEGQNDIQFLKQIAKVIRRDGQDILDLDDMDLKGELIFFPLGGSSLALWTSRLSPLNKPEFHIYDRDAEPPGQAPYQAQVDAVNERDNCIAILTSKREMENYLHFEAINESYQQHGINISFDSQFNDFDDVPALVAEAVHAVSNPETDWLNLDATLREKKISKAKRHLSTWAVPLMTTQRLTEVDVNGDVQTWFQQMAELANAH